MLNCDVSSHIATFWCTCFGTVIYTQNSPLTASNQTNKLTLFSLFSLSVGFKPIVDNADVNHIALYGCLQGPSSQVDEWFVNY